MADESKAVDGLSFVTIPGNNAALMFELMYNEARRTSCASCGVAEVDDIKLKECADCDLVKYCGDECRENHRPEHEEECKERAAELLRDELLFKQPEGTYLGDCPICCVPLPIDLKKSNMMMCCSKTVCKGCFYANAFREEQQLCPFCRSVLPKTDEEVDLLLMKRIAANDPNAMNWKGNVENDNGNYSTAFELFTKAAAFGDVDSHFRLSNMYFNGTGVEKDEGKEIHHMEEAAIGGHPLARYSLGLKEWYMRRNFERAVKHFVISATQGDDRSIKALMKMFKEGSVEKEVLAAALRAQKAAVDATKSPQRVEADEYIQKNGQH